jgi:Flp pilus assembly protein TadB
MFSDKIYVVVAAMIIAVLASIAIVAMHFHVIMMTLAVIGAIAVAIVAIAAWCVICLWWYVVRYLAVQKRCLKGVMQEPEAIKVVKEQGEDHGL